MPEELNNDHYDEEWIAVIAGKQYPLTGNQAKVIKEAIVQSSRAIIMFDTFSISLPYLQEFYRTRRRLKPKYQLAPTETPEVEYTPEQQEARRKRMEKMKADLMKKIRK